jgi:hypothetical protein
MNPTRTPQAPHRRDRGAALVVSLISLVTVAAFAALLFGSVDVEKKGTVLAGDRLQSVKLAEGALEVAEDALLNSLANYVPVADPPAGAPNQVLSGTCTAGDHQIPWTASRSTSTHPDGTEVAIAPTTAMDPATGLQLTIQPYVLEATVTVGTSAIRMRRHIEVQKAPIFQFLAFYTDDLEILPGPVMNLDGRIHTNSDLYMTAGASLTVSSKYVRAANDFHRKRKDGTAAANGWIKMVDTATGSLRTLPAQTDLGLLGILSQFGLDSSFTGWDLTGDGDFSDGLEMPPFKNAILDLLGGTLQTGEHGVQALETPEIGAIQPFVAQAGGDFVETTPGNFVAVAPGAGTHKKSHFHANADLVVLDDKVFNKAGQNITALMPSGFISTRDVWDQRENCSVPTTLIDVGKLGDMDGNPSTKDPCPYYPRNGLLFASRSGAAAGQPKGIVLTNGSELNVPSRWNSLNYGSGSGGGLGGLGGLVGGLLGGTAPNGAYAFGNAESTGLTVVSPVPVYIHGDYNSVSKKPAAVISDTVNLLSKAWDFTKTNGQVKTASDTTYNVAMIMGHRPTNGSQYSGGFENLPRFHEDWSNKTCTILGSFVSPWFSQIATGNWVYGGAYYSAPNRNWSFDTSYDQGKLPPFTPMVVHGRHVAWEVIN